MKKWISLVSLAVFLSVFSLPAYAAYSRKQNMLPAPMLIVPADDADLSGKSMLEFRWSPEGDRTGFAYYDFRLYKGNQDYEPGLMMKEQVPAGQTSHSVPASMFEAGQTYTWSVRMAGGSRKGAKAYSVFKVAKK